MEEQGETAGAFRRNSRRAAESTGRGSRDKHRVQDGAIP